MIKLNDWIVKQVESNDEIGKYMESMKYRNNISVILHHYRTDNNLTNKQLGHMIGVSANAIINAISSENFDKLTIKELNKIMKYFNLILSISEYSGYKDDDDYDSRKYHCHKCSNATITQNDKGFDIITCNFKNRHIAYIKCECENYKNKEDKK